MGVLVSDWSTALVGIDAGTMCSMGRREVPRQAGEGGSCVGEDSDVDAVRGEHRMDDLKLDV